jgi:hypothetical protein
MSNNAKVIETNEVVLSASNLSEAKRLYALISGNNRRTIKQTFSMGMELVQLHSEFSDQVFDGKMSEQTLNSKFGKHIEAEIGIPKTSRNRAMQIFRFDGMGMLIETGKINSVNEAMKYIKDANKGNNDSAGNDSEENNEPTPKKESNEFDKVLNILKQLDKLGVNDKTIEKRILANASKVLGVEVKREVETAA